LNLTRQAQTSRSRGIRSHGDISPTKKTRRLLRGAESLNNLKVVPSQAHETHQAGPYLLNKLAMRPGGGNPTLSNQGSPPFRVTIVPSSMMRLEEEKEDDLDDLELASIDFG
jgi:hypothetical protein